MAEYRNHLGCCVEITGSSSAAILLFRLLSWKPELQHEGRKWVARSHADLSYETGLSIRQVQNALVQLKDGGWITTSRHHFAGKNVLHLMVTGKALEAISEAGGRPILGDAIHQNTQIPTCGNLQVPTHQKLQVPIEQGKEQGSKQGKTVDLTVSCKPPSPPDNSGDAGKINPDNSADPKEEPVKVADILAGAKLKKDVLHKPDSVFGLHHAWMTARNAEYGKKYHPPMTGKDKGLYKQLITKFGGEKAQKIVSRIIPRWIEFTKDVEQKAGIKTTPSEPVLPFLVKHVGIAIDMVYAKKSPTNPSVLTPTPAPSTVSPSVQLIAPDEDKPMTKEELLKILAEEGGDAPG